MSRIETERLTKGRHRLRIARLLLEREPEIVVKHRRVGLERDRSVEMTDRRRHATGREIT